MRHQRLSLLSFALLLLSSGLALAADVPRAGTGIHYVYFIRHGIYDRDSTTDAVTGNGLNALGHEQARLLGVRLAALPVHAATLVSSNLRRARETAEDIGAKLGLAPSQDSLLRECSPTSVRADYNASHTPDDIARCDARMAAAWERYLTPSPDADRHDILVCHANVIRWMVSRALGEPSHWSAMEIAHASLTILAVHPDGTVRLVTFSDVGHLPLADQTWTGRGAGWGAPAGR